MNVARWLRSVRPSAGEAALEARLVKAIGAELGLEVEGDGGEP
jgi:hypothetical protein